MLELYHYSESICSERVRMVFFEKNVHDWVDRHVNLFLGEQFAPEYIRINPKAQVPTLVHDGNIVRESSLICDYIDDIHPDPPLKPEAPLARAQMREWIKLADEALFQSVSALSYASVFMGKLNAMGEEGKAAHFAKQTDIERTQRQRSCVELGTASPYVLRAVVFWEKYFGELEARLSDGRPWIMGDHYTLAEINLEPFVARIEGLELADIWMASRPFAMDWWTRCKARPSFVAASVGPGAAEADEYRQAGRRIAPEIAALRTAYLTKGKSAAP